MPKFGPMEAVADANAWHQLYRDKHEAASEDTTCWCCCIFCEHNNPHFTAAIGTWKTAR